MPVTSKLAATAGGGWAVADTVAATGCQVLGVYEPVSIVFKMLWHRLSNGGGSRVCGLVNVVLHVCNCAAAYGFWSSRQHMGRPASDELTGSGGGGGARPAPAWRECCLGSVLFFAVHPLRVETLCWASCQVPPRQSDRLAGVLSALRCPF